MFLEVVVVDIAACGASQGVENIRGKDGMRVW